MNRGEHVFLDDALADEDGVLEVVSVPGHESDEDIAAQGQLARLGARAVGDDLPLFDRLALLDENFLVDAGGGVGAHELADRIHVHSLFGIGLEPFLGVRELAVGSDNNLAAGDGGHFAGFFGHNHRARIAGDALFQTRGHQRRLGDQQRHRLALHV